VQAISADIDPDPSVTDLCRVTSRILALLLLLLLFLLPSYWIAFMWPRLMGTGESAVGTGESAVSAVMAVGTSESAVGTVITVGTWESAVSAVITVGTGESAVGTGERAVSTGESAVSTGESAVSAVITVGTGESAVGTGESAAGEPATEERLHFLVQAPPAHQIFVPQEFFGWRILPSAEAGCEHTPIVGCCQRAEQPWR
jgi:hypothetical protein